VLGDGIGAWVAVAQVTLALGTVATTVVIACATIGLRRATTVLAEEMAAWTLRSFVPCTMEWNDASPYGSNLTLRNTGTATAFDIGPEVSPTLPDLAPKPSRMAQAGVV